MTFMTYIFCKGQHIEPYINSENGNIVFLINSHSNYLMEFQNQSEQKNKDKFLTLKNCKVHHTAYTDVLAQLVTINGNIYVGLQRKVISRIKIIQGSRAFSFRLKRGQRS